MHSARPTLPPSSSSTSSTKVSPRSLPTISIVICTCNRGETLRVTLNAVVALAVPPGIQAELLVVDNNSHDNTRAVVHAQAAAAAPAAASGTKPGPGSEPATQPGLRSGSGMAIRYLFEPRTGKCHALNTAIAAARGEVVAFLDDDSIPSRDWLTSIWSEFVADPGLGALAGRVELANPADLPIMIITGRKRRVARRFEEDVDGYFAGLNWAARRSMLTAVGEYDTHFGPGARFQSTEDLEFAYRMWRAGAKMLYAPSVLTFHNHGRRTEQASRALLWSYCIGRGAFYAKYLLRGDTYAARLIYWTIAWRARQILQGKDAIRHATTILGLARGFLAYTGFRLAQPLMTSVSSRSAAALRPEAAATERAEHAA